MTDSAGSSGATSTPPRPAPSAAPASWLTGRVGLTSATWVTGAVGTGFEAYARIFHPLDDEPGSKRWSDVAGTNQRVMEWQLDRNAPTFDLPWRRYLLYEGAVGDALRFGHWVTAGWFDAQSPSLFWPDDHGWCVATELDVDSTVVGGSAALIDAIVSSSILEALPIAADAPYEDRVNT